MQSDTKITDSSVIICPHIRSDSLLLSVSCVSSSGMMMNGGVRGCHRYSQLKKNHAGSVSLIKIMLLPLPLFSFLFSVLFILDFFGYCVYFACCLPAFNSFLPVPVPVNGYKHIFYPLHILRVTHWAPTGIWRQNWCNWPLVSIPDPKIQNKNKEQTKHWQTFHQNRQPPWFAWGFQIHH